MLFMTCFYEKIIMITNDQSNGRFVSQLFSLSWTLTGGWIHVCICCMYRFPFANLGSGVQISASLSIHLGWVYCLCVRGKVVVMLGTFVQFVLSKSMVRIAVDLLTGVNISRLNRGNGKTPGKFYHKWKRSNNVLGGWLDVCIVDTVGKRDSIGQMSTYFETITWQVRQWHADWYSIRDSTVFHWHDNMVPDKVSSTGLLRLSVPTNYPITLHP